MLAASSCKIVNLNLSITIKCILNEASDWLKTSLQWLKMCETFSSLWLFWLAERTDPHWAAIHPNTLIDCAAPNDLSLHECGFTAGPCPWLSVLLNPTVIFFTSYHSCTPFSDCPFSWFVSSKAAYFIRFNVFLLCCCDNECMRSPPIPTFQFLPVVKLEVLSVDVLTYGK